MDRTVSRRSEPSSRTALMGEQPNPWDVLPPQDAMSRHRNNVNKTNRIYSILFVHILKKSIDFLVMKEIRIFNRFYDLRKVFHPSFSNPFSRLKDQTISSTKVGCSACSR